MKRHHARIIAYEWVMNSLNRSARDFRKDLPDDFATIQDRDMMQVNHEVSSIMMGIMSRQIRLKAGHKGDEYPPRASR